LDQGLYASRVSFTLLLCLSAGTQLKVFGRIMAVRVLALFFALSAAGSAACSEWEERVLNNITDPMAPDYINKHFSSKFPKTVGGCDDIVDQRPSLLPCRNISVLPITLPAEKLNISVHHITGFDTFNVTNLSFRCDAPATGVAKHWFVQLDTSMQRLAVAVDAKMNHWPHLGISAMCGPGDQCLLDQRDAKLQVIAGVGCVNEDTIGLVLDPDGGLEITPDLVIDWHGIKVDVAKPTKAAIREVFSEALIDCKKVDGGKLDKMCRLLCKGHYERAGNVLV